MRLILASQSITRQNMLRNAGLDFEIHPADIDEATHYPIRAFKNGGVANNWLEVGATDKLPNEYLVADFSNYGKQEVDLFAPGVEKKAGWLCPVGRNNQSPWPMQIYAGQRARLSLRWLVSKKLAVVPHCVVFSLRSMGIGGAAQWW